MAVARITEQRLKLVPILVEALQDIRPFDKRMRELQQTQIYSFTLQAFHAKKRNLQCDYVVEGAQVS